LGRPRKKKKEDVKKGEGGSPDSPCPSDTKRGKKRKRGLGGLFLFSLTSHDSHMVKREREVPEKEKREFMYPQFPTPPD